MYMHVHTHMSETHVGTNARMPLCISLELKPMVCSSVPSQSCRELRRWVLKSGRSFVEVRLEPSGLD